MAKRSETSWKKDNPNTFLSNSVQKADRAVKQAMTHPEEIAVEHAFNSIARADKASLHAEQRGSACEFSPAKQRTARFDEGN